MKKEYLNAPALLINLIGPEYPQLLTMIRDLIKKNEKADALEKREHKVSYLWEHSLHVALQAYNICREEGENPLGPVIAALLHDAGKFESGSYHKTDAPEEIIAARQAKKIFEITGFDKNQSREILSGLKALYNEDAPGNRIADIVHDSDFLVKTGRIGVAALFLKAFLRGYKLTEIATRMLSKELTYASALKENMHTKTGKRLAAKKSRETRSFYLGFLQELKDHGIADFQVKKINFPCPQNPKKFAAIELVVRELCPECGGKWDIDLSGKNGIKCKKMIARISCSLCSWEEEVAFCLPEIYSRSDLSK